MKFKRLFGLILFIMIVCFLHKNNVVSAKSIYLEKDKTVHFENIDELYSIYAPSGNCYYDITINNIKIKTEDGDITTEYNQYLRVTDLDSQNEYSYSEDKITFKMNGKTEEEYRRFFFMADASYLVFRRNYYIICDITVNSPDISSMKLTKTKITCYLDNLDGKTISIKNSTETVKWSLSNTKIAQLYGKGNSVILYPKKPGVCYVRAKCNGRILKCKVSIKGRKKLYAGGTITSYNTRTNIFTMKFKNCSSKKVTILPSNLIAVDSDYSSFDRKLKIGKSITIKSGQEKKIKFHVVGTHTWFNVNDFCINYSIKYKNKKYRIASDTETTWVRRNGKWKPLLTYDEISYY